jgi:hypothetical protein
MKIQKLLIPSFLFFYFYTEPDIHPIVEDFYKNLDIKEVIE